MQQIPPDEGHVLYHMLVTEVPFMATCHRSDFKVNLLSQSEFLQIFEGNYALIIMRITRDVTEGRK